MNKKLTGISLDPRLHKKAVKECHKNGQSLSAVIALYLEKFVKHK